MSLFLQDRFHRGRRQANDSKSTGSTSSDKNPVKPTDTVEKANNGDGNDSTIIYFITPSYPRREQIAELTRLGQTLMHVSRLHWIVADDRPDCSPQIMNLLPDFSENYFTPRH